MPSVKIANVFNSKKSEGQITLKGRKEGSIYQRKRDRERRKEGRKGERENGLVIRNIYFSAGGLAQPDEFTKKVIQSLLKSGISHHEFGLAR